VTGEAPSTSRSTALRYFAVSRVAVSGVLVLLVLFSDLSEAFDTWRERQQFLWVAQAYLVASIIYLYVSSRLRAHFQPQLVVHTLTDLLALVVLVHMGGSLRGGLGVLMVAAVAGAAVLSTPLLAAFFAAAAALLLLLESVWRTLGGADADLSMVLTAGLVGAACFVTAAVVNWLAVRLDRQEQLAQRRGEDLRNQLAITQLVVAELPQGVLVVGRDGTVRTFNRVAAALLGAPPVPGVSLYGPGTSPRWAMLGTALRQWAALRASAAAAAAAAATAPGGPPTVTGLPGTAGRAGSPGPDDAIELTLPPLAGEALAHQVQVRVLEPPAAAGDVVLLVEDLRNLEARAQQLKLAAMGRLSASIAHEVRNPLAAIRHANSLLAEENREPGAARLMRIVETNSVRIDRIVEDVLSMARREPPAQEAIDLRSWLPAFVAEYTTAGGVDAARIACRLEAVEPLWFDPHHLRQVLVNVLGNALRHGSNEAGAVRIAWRRVADDRLELRIADDGPGIAPDVQPHLFEPFFTTESRGTGLGLYLARELCDANGATIRYEPRPLDDPDRGAFVIEASAEMPLP
jgi:two-component system sensor histidine kinase PilS (NtrC family)